MLTIKYDLKLMKTIMLFENITTAKVKDCVDVETMLIFIVEPLEMGKAIGKKGSNVRKIENLFKRKIKIVEFSSEKTKFLANLLHPATGFEIADEGEIIKIRANDLKTRGYIIGRNATNLRMLEDIVRRYYEVKEIKVI